MLPSAGAWSNGGYSADPPNPDYGTHDWIADAALNLQTRDVTFLKTTYHSEFLLGTEAPDNPAYIGDSANHHVYYYSSGVLQDDACADRASQIYATALGYLRAGDNHSAAYDIGVMAHYVSDVGVFGHTMGAYTDWGGEMHHSDYENAFESMIGSLSPPSGISLGDSDAYGATVGLAQKITFGSSTIQTNVWMDTNYDWTSAMFETSAIASLHASVSAVAAVVNHLLLEAFPPSSPPTTPPSTPPSTTPTQTPERPSSVTAVLEHSGVLLTWSAPPSDGGSEITSYMIYRGTSPNDTSLIAAVGPNTFTWVDQSMEKGVTYYYWVVAANSVGVSAMSLETSITIPRDHSSLVTTIALSVVSLILAAGGGLLLWRRRKN